MSLLKKIPVLFLIILIFSCEEIVNRVTKSDIEVIDIVSEPEPEPEVLEEVIEEEIIEEPEIVYDLNILNDEVEFSVFPEIDNHKNYGIVGNPDAKYYSYVDLATSEDCKFLEVAGDFKLGTILEIERKIEITNTIHDTFFEFEGNKNYFYTILMDGEEMLVWGADIVTGFKDKNAFNKTWYGFQRLTGKPGFITLNGDKELTVKEINDLKSNRISISLEEKGQDLLTLYKSDSAIPDKTMFITTDLFTETLNLVFKTYRKSQEEGVLFDSISDLNVLFLDDINKLNSEDNNENLKYSETLESLKNYFLVSSVLLSYTEDGEKINELLSTLTEAVLDEYNLITGESGFSMSPVIGLNEDYSAFSPSGYYMDSDKLKAYYMTIQWFRNIELNSRMIMLIGDIIRNNVDLMELRSSISERLIFLAGSENVALTAVDIVKILEEEDVYNLAYWMEDDENIRSILSESAVFNLFGQAGNLEDNYIMNGWSSGLGYAAALGSKTSKSLLVQSNNPVIEESKSESTINNYPGLYRELITKSALFEQNRDFFFMEMGKWNQKVLNSALGGWIESHNYSITFDFDNNETIDTTEKLPLTTAVVDFEEPDHFIEPDIDYFNTHKKIVERLMEVNESEILNRYLEILDEVITIVEKEIEGEVLSIKDRVYIRNLPFELDKLRGRNEVSSPYASVIYNDIDNSSKVEAGTGYPYELTVALKDRAKGGRVATGYIYSYFEFIRDESFDNREWLELLASDEFKPGNYIPFWADDSIK